MLDAKLYAMPYFPHTHQTAPSDSDGDTGGQVGAFNLETRPMTDPIGADLIGKHCIVRTYSAGVFAGILAARDGKEALVTDARRIWYWAGAASLSELATRGTSKPENCKFPAPVAQALLTEVIEVIPIAEAAKASIDAVPEWSA